MATQLTSEKRSAIAEQLADIKTTQDLLIANEQQFLKECQDKSIRDRLEDMLEDDQKNLGIIETAIVQYGIPAEPSETVQKMKEKVQEMMQGSELSLYEKFAQFELLKHGQVMSGLVVHKAAQVTGADVEQALAPINGVNFENRAHQEQLKGMLEYLGTKELTGQEPDQSFWARLQDGLAALTGVVTSGVTKASDKSDMDLTTLIFMDHQKAKTLMREIKYASNKEKAQEYFGQLYKDLLVHSKAEEEVVYPKIRSYYGDAQTQELYDEQAELENVLNQMKSLDPTSDQFKSHLKQVKEMVSDHTREEENEVFSAIRRNTSEEQREQLATEFKEAKKRFASEMN